MSVDFFRSLIFILSYSLSVFSICVDGVDAVDGFLRPRFGKKFFRTSAGPPHAPF